MQLGSHKRSNRYLQENNVFNSRLAHYPAALKCNSLHILGAELVQIMPRYFDPMTSLAMVASCMFDVPS